MYRIERASLHKVLSRVVGPMFVRAMVVGLMMIGLSGCGISGYSTQSAPMMVGPGSQPALGKTNKTYAYNSDIYLDVAVPVFNPGFPKLRNGEVDYDEVQDKGIWPQLRRTEAKTFAVQTKNALENIGAFGSVSAVPSPTVSADLYVLGSINQSDSEVVKITTTVVDSSGRIWGEREFEHEVSPGFFRDALNKDKDPYGPIFTQMGDYVYDLIKNKSESEKQAIKNISMVRYAQHYSPETYNQYIKSKVVSKGLIRKSKHYEFELTGMPSDNDRMMNRIKVLRAQEQLFIDRLQDQYLAFDATTQEHYRPWQKETLTEVIAAKEAKAKRNTAAILSGALAIGGIALSKNSSSGAGKIGAIAAGAGAIYFASNALEKNSELKVHKASLDEMGKNLDVAVNPSVMKFDDKTVELTGTASEQYEQWKTHLRRIYELESASDQTL
jgi:hypothetical protein